MPLMAYVFLPGASAAEVLAVHAGRGDRCRPDRRGCGAAQRGRRITLLSGSACSPA
ncbi:hypothetical protein L083_6994 [Actinoplanes sp. N902-109]|nr:hypothetical protein L083_6994 [Actinoplanes sp. N902-109]